MAVLDDWQAAGQEEELKKYDIPGWGILSVEYLVLDYNGTTAIDGKPIAGIFDRLAEISSELKVHIITADTFGSVRREIGDLCQVHILTSGDHRQEKAEYVAGLGAERVVAIGNGRNDSEMLKRAALSIVLIQAEGAAISALKEADIAVCSISDALDLLLNPKRLVATLRV